MSLVLSLTGGTSASVVFDDSAAGSITISNDHYRFLFSKANGGLVVVSDLATGLEVSQGSRGGCLWGASTPPAAHTGGCSNGRTFGYSWDGDTRSLAMTWGPAADSGLEARVTIVASDEAWLDMRLELSGRHASRLDYVLFPSEILFRESDVRQVLLPILPGVALNPRFFAEDRSYMAKYPGEGMFSDFFALDSAAGSLSIYVLGEGRAHPSILGVVHDGEDRAYYSHAFAVRLAPGERWVSPTIRWRLGGSFVDAARAFRRDSGIEALPSIGRRLGPLYASLMRAPFLKIDMERMRRPFADYERLLEELPVPSVLHWVAFGDRGFDEDYPDFLPPHPSHGTTEQFAALFRKARAMGHLNMPYTNPTWWDDESPTLRSLPAPLTVPDVAVVDDAGTARYETFGLKGGYAVSPWHPFVRQRADQSVSQMTSEVPSDLIFQDQIGARPWLFDSNPAAPFPMSYIDGWIAHTKRHPDRLLGTEQGFDALIPTEVAFFGSVPAEDDDWSEERFGKGNWDPWPFVPIVAGDKVLRYPHNMGANPPTDSTIRLNVAFGRMMMHVLHDPRVFNPGPGGGLDLDSFRVVSALQQRVISRYAGETIEEFEQVAPGVTRTKFRSVEVIANGDPSSKFEFRGHVILPGGFLVMSDDETLIAGVFDRFGGIPLAPGRHVLIVERDESGIGVWKPSGGASSVVVEPLGSWTPGTPIEIRAIDVRGDLVRTVPVTMTGYGVLFRYSTSFDGRLVDHYEIVDPTRRPRRRGVRP